MAFHFNCHLQSAIQQTLDQWVREAGILNNKQMLIDCPYSNYLNEGNTILLFRLQYKQNYQSVQMDSRIYFHQYRRPRVSNPTYLSSNVQNSMTFFNGGQYPQPTTRRQYVNQYKNEPNRGSMVKPQPTIEQYRPQQLQNAPRYQQMQQYMQPTQNQRQPPSKLSNYGERTLKMDQRGIHDKQTSKFDIINLKPRQHSQDIKQYPWLTVQNRDDVYYRRMSEMYNAPQSRSNTTQKQTPSNVAGRHTYDLQPKISIDPEKGNQKYFTAKMLNHMDELQHNLA